MVAYTVRGKPMQVTCNICDIGLILTGIKMIENYRKKDI